MQGFGRGLAVIAGADASGLLDLARYLQTVGHTLVASSHCAAQLRTANIPVQLLENLTRLPDLLSGRARFLHPAVMVPVLTHRAVPEEAKQLWNQGWAPIDVVVVQLSDWQPLGATTDATAQSDLDACDGGSVALLRAAAQNHQEVLVVTDPIDYPVVLAELKGNRVTPERRRALAAKAMAAVVRHDQRLAAWLAGGAPDLATLELQPALAPVPSLAPGSPLASQISPLSSRRSGVAIQALVAATEADAATPHQTPAAPGDRWLDVAGLAPKALAHGSNAHQEAVLLEESTGRLLDPAEVSVLQGPPLGFDAWLDLDLACATLADFPLGFNAVVTHRGNPCGAAQNTPSLAGALMRAIGCDPLSAQGGVLALSHTVDLTAARGLIAQRPAVVVAPGYDDETLEVFQEFPDLTVVRLNPQAPGRVRQELRVTRFGLLLQAADDRPLSVDPAATVSKAQATAAQRNALDLAWRVAKHVRSYGVVTADEYSTIGIGAGQMSRSDAVVIALGRGRKGTRAIAAASDGPLLFPELLETLSKVGITAVIAPRGGPRDGELAGMANRLGLCLILAVDGHLRS